MFGLGAAFLHHPFCTMLTDGWYPQHPQNLMRPRPQCTDSGVRRICDVDLMHLLVSEYVGIRRESLDFEPLPYTALFQPLLLADQ